MPPQVQLHQKHAALQAEHGAAKEQAVREVDAERALAAAASAAARWGLICGNGVDALCRTKYAITETQPHLPYLWERQSGSVCGT
jgi:hypothetical protein